jgi:hypothetical protein
MPRSSLPLPPCPGASRFIPHRASGADPLNWPGGRFLFSSPSNVPMPLPGAAVSSGRVNENRSGPLCQERFWTPLLREARIWLCKRLLGFPECDSRIEVSGFGRTVRLDSVAGADPGPLSLERQRATSGAAAGPGSFGLRNQAGSKLTRRQRCFATVCLMKGFVRDRERTVNFGSAKRLGRGIRTRLWWGRDGADTVGERRRAAR